MTYDKTITTEQYRHGDYIIELEETEEAFCVWVCRDGYSVKEFVVGLPKDQPEGTLTKKLALAVLEANLADYIAWDKEQYEVD